jgi:hypothetical protein
MGLPGVTDWDDERTTGQAFLAVSTTATFGFVGENNWKTT